MTTLTSDPADAPSPRSGRKRRALPEVSNRDLDGSVREILNRRPAVGLAVGVVRDREPVFFHGHGLADIPSRMPITEDTIFRIGSITKLFTAIAVMQLVEDGRIDLDAPASDYLRAYRVIPAQAGWRPATVRHLLTHTAGIPEIRGAADLLNASLMPSGGRPGPMSVDAGQPLPSLATYYRDGLRIVVEPGTAFAYSNHGFATLGQIVEDVSAESLEGYLRKRIFAPLGMADTNLVRSERVASRLATGYSVGRTGPRAVADREWIDAGAGQIYSSPRDMARFVAALLGGGANAHGRMLGERTLAAMFEPHYRPDRRIPGIGLAFFRGDLGGHRVVEHDGILPGFNSGLLLAPDDGIGLVAFTNGSSGAFGWLQMELDGLLGRLLGVAPEGKRDDIPHHPEFWADLCGRYVFQPRIADLRNRLLLPRGVEVRVSGGRLEVCPRAPVPLAGLPLEPDDENDPDVFRLDTSRFGIPPTRVVFSRQAGDHATAAHTDLGGQPWSLIWRPDSGTSERWLRLGLAAVAGAGLTAALGTRHRRKARTQP